ncbi:NRAMP family divalent metal transporter [Sphingomonas nostoxanthinifaciens]|uniref:NRAMP family divalent metal transporter n=1 Tax=Sphingomonas nostoxanthinifaciens TaxID=2872652 RepID=UPI001CC20913|nr:divalent metal cation transporter [Sphingomonas nostoxanthinifaciens]UAK23086.1 divalent metal cation transporter [Sphingomonas nostoxanthinifaciens]
MEPAASNAHADVKQPERPKLLKMLGPGLITGASDDDPSGIATYSQVGAQFGYGLSWVMLFSWPLMCAIQEISARIGRVTGRGIAGNLKHHYAAPIGYSVVLLVVIANVINLGADLGAMGAGLKLLIGGPSLLYVAAFGGISVLLEVFSRYSRYVSVLKWLTLSLFAYVAVACVVHVPWGTVAHSLVVPSITYSTSYVTAVVAILGTTISPYLFFWQAEEEVEEVRERPDAKPLQRAPEQAVSELKRIRIDTYVGMALSNGVALFIIITAAATLNANGITDIQTSSQAAQALRPIAGKFAFFVFATGIIGTGLIALPVLAGSSAYALGEMLGWHVGLARKPDRAKAFYVCIAVATALGVLMNLTPIDPIKALFWSAVINGVAAVPIMALMMIMSTNKRVMGNFQLPIGSKLIGWLATAVMAVAAAGLLIPYAADL